MIAVCKIVESAFEDMVDATSEEVHAWAVKKGYELRMKQIQSHISNNTRLGRIEKAGYIRNSYVVYRKPAKELSLTAKIMRTSFFDADALNGVFYAN